jgi:hypothetical protein
MPGLYRSNTDLPPSNVLELSRRPKFGIQSDMEGVGTGDKSWKKNGTSLCHTQPSALFHSTTKTHIAHHVTAIQIYQALLGSESDSLHVGHLPRLKGSELTNYSPASNYSASATLREFATPKESEKDKQAMSLVNQSTARDASTLEGGGMMNHNHTP